MVYVTKMPDGLNLCLPLIRESPKVFTSHTLPVFYKIKFQTTVLSKREVNEMICIKEVGVDLELCVHAHENDVDRLGSFLENDYPAV